MPLSDHERRLLDQIEQGLATDRPRRAVARSPAVWLRRQVSVLGAVLGVVAGLALLYLGLRLADANPQSPFARDLGTAFGVLAYTVITLAAYAGIRAILDRWPRSDPPTGTHPGPGLP